MTERPLVVDLDGTLVLTDLLYESALKLLRDTPLKAISLLSHLGRGRAAFKQRVCAMALTDPASLPYNTELLDWLQVQKRAGRELILCTAADERAASAVAGHLGIFDEVLASDGTNNMKGAEKARVLSERYGAAGFDYVGDSVADLPVWSAAGEAIVVGREGRLSDRVQALNQETRILPRPTAGPGDWLGLLRVQQWLKNLLLFAPFLAAHRWHMTEEWLVLFAAFIAFGLCASATYLLNDLLDLESDRLHPRKRSRALASGQIPLWQGVLALPVLLLAGLIIAALLGAKFLLCLLLYLCLTSSYSFILKRLILLDCLVLAVLYTLRIIAGAAAVDMGVSFWLLAFSVFLFLSLAFVKRYAEIEVQQAEGRSALHGRGYLISDISLVLSLGVGAGYLAVLVLALYLNSAEVILLYSAPQIVWGAVLVLLYWISWIWLKAHRGEMHDDPLVFAIKDRTSLVCGGLFLLAVYLGSLPW